jgi:hypothetical protein
LNAPQALASDPSGAISTTITNWTDLGPSDYIQDPGFDASTGVYTVSSAGIYHIFVTMTVQYTPTNGAASYNSLNNPLLLQLNRGGFEVPIIATQFSNNYAGVGGSTNSINLVTYDTATMVGDLAFTFVGNQFILQVQNPFIDNTPIYVMPGSRWSMRQFA